MDKPSDQFGYAVTIGDEAALIRETGDLRACGIDSARIFSDLLDPAPGTPRPGLEQLLAAAPTGAAIVVQSLSRLGRSAGEVVETVDRIRDLGLNLVAQAQWIDTSKNVGPSFFDTMAVLAGIERDASAAGRSRSRRRPAGDASDARAPSDGEALRNVMSVSGTRKRKRRPGGGRRSVFNDETTLKVVKLMDQGYPFVRIASEVGCSRSTLYNNQDYLRARLAAYRDQAGHQGNKKTE